MKTIDVLPLEYEEVVDAGNKNGLVRRIKCPFCFKTYDFIPANADLWRHECPNRYGHVYILNGHAVSGANQYNFKESGQTKKKLGGGGLGDQTR